ncbi:hypothetical protein RFI_08475 [Reticulomyxa filosa]|uniref:Uncharacterized protein n=1 Tax=Reticulomyxa filosa TaxID=46433 RepID=X6NSD1_RETFI|nr:hypothetical protein RFI_08475 [Reticulomyxa filosa]|eukprot:ETO28654.1 hypothetical protein RFI_08475 [Reticulomyxa filosa]
MFEKAQDFIYSALEEMLKNTSAVLTRDPPNRAIEQIGYYKSKIPPQKPVSKIQSIDETQDQLFHQIAPFTTTTTTSSFVPSSSSSLPQMPTWQWLMADGTFQTYTPDVSKKIESADIGAKIAIAIEKEEYEILKLDLSNGIQVSAQGKTVTEDGTNRKKKKKTTTTKDIQHRQCEIQHKLPIIDANANTDVKKNTNTSTNVRATSAINNDDLKYNSSHDSNVVPKTFVWYRIFLLYVPFVLCTISKKKKNDIQQKGVALR